MPVSYVEWHHACLTWVGDSGALQAYFNGRSYERGDPVMLNRRIDVGGSIKVRREDPQHQYYLTELNIWDYQMSTEQIIEKSLECSSGYGNVLAWQALMTTFEGFSQSFISPSSCPTENARSQSDFGESTMSRKRKNEALLKYTREQNVKTTTVRRKVTSGQV